MSRCLVVELVDVAGAEQVGTYGIFDYYARECVYFGLLYLIVGTASRHRVKAYCALDELVIVWCIIVIRPACVTIVAV